MDEFITQYHQAHQYPFLLLSPDTVESVQEWPKGQIMSSGRIEMYFYVGRKMEYARKRK